MIYFDNAATTKYKPQEVIDAYIYYINEIGVSPGRGSYSLGIQASRMLYQSRITIAKYFGLDEPNVVFTKNSTEAINLLFRGFLKKGDHVVISPYEHNAVLRPLEKLHEEGIVDYSIIEREDLVKDPNYIIGKYIRDNTTLLALTLASNLTGRIVFNPDLFHAAKATGITTFVDSSQGAGKIRINMINDGIDYLAFTGHKDLRGLPGVGGLCCQTQFDFPPFVQGGTGILGHYKTTPTVFPEGYEAGTLNMPAIWALKTAIEMLTMEYESIIQKETQLSNYLQSSLSRLKNVTIYDSEFERVCTWGINVSGHSSNDIVRILDENGICTRGGIHCAILPHEMFKTTNTGIVRISLSEHNTKEEINELLIVLDRVV